MGSESKRRRLKNLLKSNPHCFWCGCFVILGNRKHGSRVTHPPNMATLDHIISRNNRNWKRGKRNILILSCSECNQGRQIKETKSLPIEELWRRSGCYYRKKGATDEEQKRLNDELNATRDKRPDFQKPEIEKEK